MTSHYLSRRQTILAQHLNRCMVDIERIGDHIDELCDLSLRRQKISAAMFDREALEKLFDLYKDADRVLQLVIQSLDFELQDFQSAAQEIMAARDAYVAASMDTKGEFAQRIEDHTVTPISAMYFAEYIAVFDKIVRHSKNIAIAQSLPEFWIKRRKLDQPIKDTKGQPAIPDKVDIHDFLDRLQNEDYL